MQFTDVAMTAKGAILIMLYVVFLLGRLTGAQTLIPLVNIHMFYLPGMKVSCVFYLLVFARKPPLPLQKHHLILLYKAN